MLVVDIEVAQVFATELKKIIAENDFPPDFFNVDETELYWEMLQSRTYIWREEKSAPGFKAFEDRLTLLLGGECIRKSKIKAITGVSLRNFQSTGRHSKKL